MPQSYDRRINLYINGTQVKNDISSIRKEMYKLTNEQAHMTIGSREYYAQAAKIKQLKGIMAQHVQDINNVKKGWSLQGMADSFNRYFAIVTAAMASFAGAVLTIKASVQAYAEFDDKLADVMKTTGLTKDQVKALNAELAKLDSRSAQQELLDLARVAGKLGITSEEDILGFVRAADKIKIALSEDLGGDIEESINQLGKLVDVFGTAKEFGIEESLLKVGSAINSLGAAGTANEAYIVEFSKRMAGIAPSAGISIQNVLGLAATLDELAVTSEVSGTVVNNVIAAMFKDTATYAGIARMKVEEFANLMSTDANEAFIQLLQGAKGSGSGFAEMATNLDKLGLDGARSTGVLTVLANNIDKLREKQAYSNVEFEKGTSIIKEFNTKNQSAQAELEKAKKRFTALQVELGERLAPAYTSVIHKSSALLKIIGATVEFLFKYGGQIMVVIASITAYSVAVKAAAFWEGALNKEKGIGLFLTKTGIVINRAASAAMLLYQAAVAALAGNFAKATRAMQLFWAFASLNPIGILVAAVTALAGAMYLYSKRVTDAVKIQRMLTAVNVEAEKQIAEQKIQVEQLLKVAQDDNRSKADRIDAIKQLNELSPDYLKGLTLETINTDAAKTATDKYINSLRQKAKIQAANEKLVEIEKELIDLQQGQLSFWDETKAAGLFYAAGLRLQTTKTKDLAELDAYRTKKAEELNLQKEKLLEITTKQIGLNKTSGTTTDNTGGTDGASLVPGDETKNVKLKLLPEISVDSKDGMDKFDIADQLARDEAQRLAEQQASEEEWTEFLKEQIRIRTEAEAQALEIEKEIADARMALKDMQVDAIGQLASSLAGMFEQGSAAQIAAIAIEKGIAIAQIMINYAREMSAISLASANIAAQPFPGARIAALGYFATMSAKAKVQAGINTGIVVAQAVSSAVSSGKRKKTEAYASGGFTTGEGLYIAGEGNKKEWIAPNWMLTNPSTQPTIAALESLRSNRSSTLPLNSGGVPAGGGGIGGSYADPILSKLDELNRNIANLKIYTAIEDIKKGDKKYTEIQSTRGL